MKETKERDRERGKERREKRKEERGRSKILLPERGFICAKHIKRVTDLPLLRYNLNKAATGKQKLYVIETNK